MRRQLGIDLLGNINLQWTKRQRRTLRVVILQLGQAKLSGELYKIINSQVLSQGILIKEGLALVSVILETLAIWFPDSLICTSVLNTCFVLNTCLSSEKRWYTDSWSLIELQVKFPPVNQTIKTLNSSKGWPLSYLCSLIGCPVLSVTL